MSDLQLHLALDLPQSEALGAVGAQPEVFNPFVLSWMIFSVKAKESAAIKSHECLSARGFAHFEIMSQWRLLTF